MVCSGLCEYSIPDGLRRRQRRTCISCLSFGTSIMHAELPVCFALQARMLASSCINQCCAPGGRTSTRLSALYNARCCWFVPETSRSLNCSESGDSCPKALRSVERTLEWLPAYQNGVVLYAFAICNASSLTHAAIGMLEPTGWDVAYRVNVMCGVLGGLAAAGLFRALLVGYLLLSAFPTMAGRRCLCPCTCNRVFLLIVHVQEWLQGADMLLQAIGTSALVKSSQHPSAAQLAVGSGDASTSYLCALTVCMPETPLPLPAPSHCTPCLRPALRNGGNECAAMVCLVRRPCEVWRVAYHRHRM